MTLTEQQNNRTTTTKEIISFLEKYCGGLYLIQYDNRYENGKDNRKLKIHLIMDTFCCSWRVANKVVGKANGYFPK